MNTYALKIRKLREIHGYPQEYVAFQMGISQAAYSRKESGSTELSISCLTKLSKLYGISLIDLIKYNAQELLLHAIRQKPQSVS
jgi:transcriptional regulator with XRE-family HTH domain